MKNTLKSILTIVFTITTLSVYSQDKKTHKFDVTRVIPSSAASVWALVGEDFGGIAKSHPKIVSSEFNQGHITGGEGATRTCNMN